MRYYNIYIYILYLWVRYINMFVFFKLKYLPKEGLSAIMTLLIGSKPPKLFLCHALYKENCRHMGVIE